ncbi:MAG: restriction endonuclease subunit S, partial [Lachnospiraceae bacterium]|nr:restriction endonuclease subunit S [Lachnospiraceae bacterium]
SQKTCCLIAIYRKSFIHSVSARGTIGFVCLRHIPYTPIVRLVTLVPYTEVISAKYLYLWLKNIPIHGTGTTQQQLTVPDFRKTKITVPTAIEMNSFTETVMPLFQQIWVNQAENDKLADVRDTLLPRLMSGELDISKIDL